MSRLYKVSLTSIILLSVSSASFGMEEVEVKGNLSGNRVGGMNFSLINFTGSEPASKQYSNDLHINGNAKDHTDKGYELAKSGSHLPAMIHYKKAVESNPNYSRAFHAWGYSLVSLGQYEKAIDKLSEALANSEHPNSFFLLGRALEGVANYKQALINYSKAIEKASGLHKDAEKHRLNLYKKIEQLSSNPIYTVDAKPDLKIMKYPYYGNGGGHFTSTLLPNNTKIKLVLADVSHEIQLGKKSGKYSLIKYGNHNYGYAFSPYIIKYKAPQTLTRNTKKSIIPTRIQTNATNVKSQDTIRGRNYTVQLASFASIQSANKALTEYKEVGAYVYKDRTTGRAVVAVGRFVDAVHAKKVIPSLKNKLKMRGASFFPKKVQ